MNKTKKLTLSAMVTALGVLFMALGAVLAVLDLSTATLASLLMCFVYLELGSPYTWLVWLATALLSFVMFPGSFMWLSYLLVFGVYPIIKGYIERLPRLCWIPIKLLFVNVMMTVMLLFSEVLIGVSFFGDVSNVHIGSWFIDPRIIYAAIWVLLNAAFMLFDRLIVVLVIWYQRKLRPRFANLLK